jgi:hypothetical protein
MSAESDRRLEQAASLYGELDTSIDEESTSIDPSMAELLVSLYEQERLWANIAEPYRLASLAWSAVGQRWRSLQFARLGIEFAMIDGGPRSEIVSELRDLVASVEEHWSWKSSINATE